MFAFWNSSKSTIMTFIKKKYIIESVLFLGYKVLWPNHTFVIFAEGID